MCDLKNLAEGWFHLETGKRPVRLFDPDGGFPPPPHPEAKQGILVRVKMQGAATGVGVVFSAYTGRSAQGVRSAP